MFPTQETNLCLLSPALAGRFFTNEPPGKPSALYAFIELILWFRPGFWWVCWAILVDFSYMKQTLYFWNIINFVIMFYVLFYILMSQFPNALRFYLNMIQGIPKYFSLKVRASLWWSQWYDSGKGVQNCSGYLEGSGPRSKLLKQLQFCAIWWLLSTLTIYNAEW